MKSYNKSFTGGWGGDGTGRGNIQAVFSLSRYLLLVAKKSSEGKRNITVLFYRPKFNFTELRFTARQTACIPDCSHDS